MSKNKRTEGKRVGLEDHLEVGRKWVESLRIAIAINCIIYIPQKTLMLAAN